MEAIKLTHTPIILTGGKQPITLQPTKMTIYLQSTIIEANSLNDEVYYIFYYKNNYLTTKKTSKVRLNSHIHKALTKGITFYSPHPIINEILPENRRLHSHTFKELFKQLDSKNSPIEIALIATFFESFIPHKPLLKLIQSNYYKYARDGNLFACYQIIRLLLSLSHKDTWIKEFSSKREYYKYKSQYENPSKELLRKDVICAETQWYAEKDSSIESFLQLISLYESENRWCEVIALSIEQVKKQPTADQYKILFSKLKNRYELEEVMVILEDMMKEVPNFDVIKMDLLNMYLHLQHLEKSLQLLRNYPTSIKDSQLNQLVTLLDDLDLEHSSIPFEDFAKLILTLFKSNSEKLEQYILKFVVVLLKKHDLSFVMKFIEPFQPLKGKLPIINKLNKMYKLKNDPDNQLLLGEMYYQLKQIDQAIECFSWDMELKERDPKPVQWLAKIYRETGKMYEYKAYQQHYMNLQKNTGA
ncbi:tetratricopeptide repeat protein [Bacillus sp. FJAT-45066]|uniref:tetratricopeptide repeat protein n=1 Tax=Bacillus sp. FJAT-45066 TaxID=2011010 RepID=UPI000BB679F0|nr:hypothetical protein [Bacillus sp. FJAT-45066]